MPSGSPPYSRKEFLFDRINYDADNEAGQPDENHPSTTMSGIVRRRPMVIRNPRPVLAAISSAATSVVQQAANAIWSAPNTIGNADGMQMVQKIFHFEAPYVLPFELRWGWSK